MTQSPDSALVAYATLLAIHRIAVDPAQLRHELGHHEPPTAQELLRIAKRQPDVRAKLVQLDWAKLDRLPLPAMAEGHGGWFLLGRVNGGEALIQNPGEAPCKVTREELEEIWSGRLILLTTREGAAGQTGKFDVRWFIPQMVRYRRLIGEVLLITLALNLLGLATPLFFQNVIDKVLVHNTLATLQVLAFGFAAVSIWEVAFGWLRTRLFSETSQKIDVELGSRLFRHLLGLPLAYFESRRVGDTVTRVRQLETIREFLTNASLSVLVDPVFTVVFLVAMWFYSHTLFWIVIASVVGYVVVSLFVTKPLRHRLDDKFERGAANNALLVESVSGMQTVKAAAVEPQWQDRWERQLAGYSAANQRVITWGTPAARRSSSSPS